MRHLISMLALTVALLAGCESSSVDPYQVIPIFAEQVNPRLRHHHARYRSFVFQKSSEIRIGRSIQKGQNKSLIFFK